MTSMKMLKWSFMDALLCTLVLSIMGSYEGAALSKESHAVSALLAIAIV